MAGVVALPEDIAERLWRYGEDELAVRMLDSDDATWEQVIVTAAGTSRPLARQRLRPDRQLAELWAQVGPERDQRLRD